MSVELGAWALGFVLVVCLLSGFAHGALGFGFPIVATPLVALVIDIKSAIALLAPLTLLLVAISVLRGGGVLILVRQFWFMVPAMALGAWLGTRLLLAAPPEPFVLVLALVILLYLNLERFGRGESAAVKRRRVAFGVGFGFLAGMFEALANVAGPMLLIYFMLLGTDPAQMVQTLNLCFAVGKSTQVLTWEASGAMTSSTWLAVGLLAAPSVAALFVGMRMRERIDAPTYRRWLRGALWVMAALLIGQLAVSRALAADEPLLAAIERGDQVLSRELIAKGADIHARSSNGETALHLAALHDDPYYVELLLAAGADPRALNKDGESPLFWAALSGHLACAEQLLARGADPNAGDLKGNTVLHAAADGGNVHLARLLLPRVRSPGARNREGLTAKDYARRGGHRELEKLLERFD
jgi:uncharacterized membrane protein YfcA